MTPIKTWTKVNIAANLWVVTAFITASSHILLVYRFQSLEATMLVSLAWLGALFCIEDIIPELNPTPSLVSFILGVILLSFCIWRMSVIFHSDVTIYILCLFQGMGLALLLRPLGGIKEFISPLACLTTPILTIILMYLISIPLLSQVTAKVTQGLLLLFGQDARVIGSEVWLSGGGVRIAGSCSGSESIKLMSVIAFVFILAFPLPSRRTRIIFLLLAPVAALLGNAFRIGLLAIVNSSGLIYKQKIFDFFHEEYGSLVFSIITASIFCKMYLLILDYQLKTKGVINEC